MREVEIKQQQLRFMIVKFGQKKRDNDPFQTQRNDISRLYSLTTINVKWFIFESLDYKSWPIYKEFNF